MVNLLATEWESVLPDPAIELKINMSPSLRTEFRLLQPPRIKIKMRILDLLAVLAQCFVVQYFYAIY